MSSFLPDAAGVLCFFFLFSRTQHILKRSCLSQSLCGFFLKNQSYYSGMPAIGAVHLGVRCNQPGQECAMMKSSRTAGKCRSLDAKCADLADKRQKCLRCREERKNTSEV